MMKMLRTLVLVIGGGLLFGACSEEATEIPNTIRVGVLPDQSSEKLRAKFAPLLKHLAAATGIAHTLVVPNDYAHLLEMFEAKKVDLAYFGGFTFVKAHADHGAMPLVMRDVDVWFQSYFLARAESKGAALKDFAGRRLAFGSRLSTSGHLMPRHFLVNKEIKPEDFFSEVSYSGSHDRTVMWVRDGKADLGAVNAAIVNRMYADKTISLDQVRIVWKSPPYPDYVWVVRGGIAKTVTDAVREAFLTLSVSDKGDADILGTLGAGVFLPAQLSDFEELRRIATNLGLI